MANVVLRDVRKTYTGGFEAIKGIDFEVGDGQFCVLVGPSGCGKSTLLRMVAGLETITSGDIRSARFNISCAARRVKVSNKMRSGRTPESSK